ncbi:MAG: HEAT repeat protein [Planctomycetaceae bacterium]|jgi:HEAT repeat protein
MKTQPLSQRHPDIMRAAYSGRTIMLAVAMSTLVAACATRRCAAQSAVAANDAETIVEPQLLRLRDPEFLMAPRIRRMPTSYLPLWIEALAGPEYGLKRDVAMSIARAHRDGYLDCSTARDALTMILDDTSTPRSVLVEVARALIKLDAKASCPNFKELLKKGPGIQFESVVEPALALWGDADMRQIWQQRLTAADVTRNRLMLAVQAFAALPESMTADETLHADLEKLIADRRASVMIVLEAARTLGQIKRADLESVAQPLLTSSTDGSQLERLTGVYLLLHHESASSQTLLLQSVTESLSEPRHAPMIRAAWTRLLQRNVSKLSTLAPEAITHVDPEVRRNAINTLVRFPSEDGVRLLGVALDDRHPDIRRAARQALLILSSDDSLNDSVRLAGLAAIARASWREQEQAVVLLALLNQSNAANRMIQLINSPRAEVAIAAAWGLRKLNVVETLATLLKIAETMDKQIDDGQTLQPHQPTVLAQLFEALGRAKHQPAVPLLKRWLPKTTVRVAFREPRSSAFWAIGLLYEDSKDVALAEQLKARYLDEVSLEPEPMIVRYAAGISIGRIGAVEVAQDVKLFAVHRGDEASLAGAWAVQRLTGEVLPPPAPQFDAGGPWKLSPIGSRLKVDSAESPAR